MGYWNHPLSFFWGQSECFSPKFFHEIRWTFICYIDISPFQILLVYCSLYQYEVIFFILFFIILVLGGDTLYIYKASYNVSNITYIVLFFSFSLKSSLIGMKMATLPAFKFHCLGIFFHPSTFRLSLYLPGKHISHFLQEEYSSVLFFLNVAYHSVSVNWIVEIINIQRYYWKVCSNSCHFAVFVMSDSFSILTCCLFFCEIYSFPWYVSLSIICVGFL
jgi:hypothetical protein